MIVRLEHLLRTADDTWFLSPSDLREAHLCDVDLTGLRLSEATPEDANLTCAGLEGMDLTGSQLQRAN